jgi:NhaC family Na+:H+ antiporter
MEKDKAIPVSKKPKLWMVMIPIVFMIASLSITIVVFKGNPHIPLLLSAVVAGLVAWWMGYTWEFNKTYGRYN